MIGPKKKGAVGGGGFSPEERGHVEVAPVPRRDGNGADSLSCAWNCNTITNGVKTISQRSTSDVTERILQILHKTTNDTKVTEQLQ